MRQIILRLTVVALTFAVGVTCAASYHVFPTYRAAVLDAREATLRDGLFRMRKMIDQFAADKGSLPQSLDDLVSAGYLREIPVDPFTGRGDWVVLVGDDPNSPKGGKGVIDVRSASSAKAREGTPYKEW